MAVVASATGAAVFGLSGVAAGVAGGALLGAGAGALYSGITGDGNVLNSALTGGLIGGAVGGIGTAAAGSGLFSGASSGALGGAGTAASAPAASPALTAATLPSAIPEVAAGSSAFGSVGSASIPAAGEALAPVVSSAAPSAITPAVSEMAINPATGLSWEATGSGLTGDGATVTAKDLLAAESAGKPGLTNMEMLGYGLAGTTALSLLGGMNQKKLSSTTGTTPSYIRPSTYNVTQNQSAYPTTPQYGSNGLPILPTSEQRYFNQSYTAGTPYQAADGGLMSVPPAPGMMQSGPADVNFMGNDMYPTSQQHRSFYATPSQMPTSAQEVMASYEPKTNPLTGQMMKNMATGGIADAYNLGSYSDGGRLLKGPGDGVSDDIPAVIGDKQPARLADGEFVIPARIVSELGNGSTDAGAKRLYAMMDKIQAGRKKTIGKGNVAKDTKAKKHLLA